MSETKPLMTPEVMLGHFPKIFEMGLPDDKGTSYYETDLLFSPEAQKTAEYIRIKEAMKQAAMDEWKGKPPSNLRSAFRPAGEKRRQKDQSQYYPDDQFAGWELVRVKTKNQPGVVASFAGPDGRPAKITDESEIYGGCIVRCTINPNAYSVSGNNGVSFWLNNVQKMRDGDPLSGGSRSRAEDDFTAVGDVSSAAVDEMFS